MSRLAQNSGHAGRVSLPSGWRSDRLKRVVEVSNGSDPETDGNVPVYGSGGRSFKTCGEFKEGPSVLLGRKGTIDIPRYVEGQYWNVDTAFDVKSLHGKIDIRFFFYAAHTFDYRFFSTQTTVPSMTQKDYRNMILRIPPFPEQGRIAAFLDEKCAAVDTAIEVKQKQLESIAAIWKNLLYRATTQGVEGRDARPARPQDLGGDGGHAGRVTLPSGWRCVRLKDCFSYGKGLNITKVDLVADGTPVISYGQIHAKQNDGTHLKDELLRYVPDDLAQSNPGAKLKMGDIVFADTSEDLDGIGNCVLNDVGDGVYAGYHTLIARARDPRNSKYLSYLFQTDWWREQLRKRACGIKVFSLTQRLLSNVKVVLPPQDEQKLIVKYLDARHNILDSLAANLRKQIEALEQYRKSLIHEYVTGVRRVV